MQQQVQMRQISKSSLHHAANVLCSNALALFFFIFATVKRGATPLHLPPPPLLPAAYCAPLSKALCMRHTQLLLLLLLYKPKRTKTFAAGWAAHSAGHKNADSKIMRRIPGRKPTFRLTNAFCPWRRLSPPIVPIQGHI